MRNSAAAAGSSRRVHAQPTGHQHSQGTNSCHRHAPHRIPSSIVIRCGSQAQVRQARRLEGKHSSLTIPHQDRTLSEEAAHSQPLPLPLLFLACQFAVEVGKQGRGEEARGVGVDPEGAQLAVQDEREPILIAAEVHGGAGRIPL
jgi:hypothetical protein